MYDHPKVLGVPGRGLSGNLWQPCPISRLREDPAAGLFYFDDFVDVPVADGGTTIRFQGKYRVVTGTGVTITDGASPTGVMRFNLPGTDAVGAVVGAGGGMARFNPAQLESVFFEARFQVSTVADDRSNVFLGLCAGPLDTGIPWATEDGLVNNRNMVGIARRTATGKGNKLALAYKTGTQAGQFVDLENFTLAADTWVTAGFAFMPRRQRMDLFVNNVRTQSLPWDSVLATTWPSGDVGLCPVIALRNGSANASSVLVDWIAAAYSLL